MGTLYLVAGIILLLLLMYDFFFTTLSANGAGFISKNVTVVAHKAIQRCVGWFGRAVYNFSGLLMNIIILTVWVLVVWLGVYLIYSSNPAAITDSKGIPADVWERMYFTGYTLSTLGMGDFKPTSPFFEFITSCFSFFGFIFFTSSMTYFISVSSAVVNKRTIVRSIENLGKDPQAIARQFLKLDKAYCFSQCIALQEMIDRHSVNHQSYPVIHFYSHPQPEVCLSIHIARLDEAITILLNSVQGEKLHTELQPLRESITTFLKHLTQNYSRTLPQANGEGISESLPYDIHVLDRNELHKRRKLIERLLRSESFTWADVTGATAS